MNFVDYESNPFSGLNKTEQTILSATSNVLVVNSIVVCNRTSLTLRFNLKKVRTQETPVDVFYLNELEVKPYQTIDAVQELGFNNIFLQYQETPAISDSLICYSNGLKQVFDCEISYSKLNEAPYTI